MFNSKRLSWLLLSLLVLTTSTASPQSMPPIGIIDFYGLRTVTPQQVRNAIGVKEGGSLSEAPEAIQHRLKALPGVEDAHIARVCCHEGKTILFVGLREKGTPSLQFRPAPTGKVQLASEIVQAGKEYEKALQEAVLKGDSAEEHSQGHALAHDPTVRAIQQRFIVFAMRYQAQLRDVLHHSSAAGERALAAEVLAYAEDKQALAADLAEATRDADEGVRNNASRALLVMALSAGQSGKSRLRISPLPFVRMLNSVVWTDRNKALGALYALTTQRDAATLALLRSQALPALIEMASWKVPNYAQPAVFLLGRIGGMAEEEIDKAWKRGDREVVIRAAKIKSPVSRPFHMGFTPWPADLSTSGLLTARDFAHAHGDIVSIMLIGGLPWPEALENEPFSQDVENILKYRSPAGKKLFLSISPLDKERKGLAPYWGSKDNLPLPAPWNTLPLNSPLVKKAFLAFTMRAVQTMKPDYLAIGIESNVLLSKDPTAWVQLKDLHRATYAALKKEYPQLPVFFTTEVLHYKKLASEAKDKEQEKEVADLMRHSDLFAMSVYPHMSFDVPRPVPEDFVDFAKQFKKPLAVSESGMTSRNVELKAFKLTLRGSETDQQQFTTFLLQTAARDGYEFVINFATTDFEKLVAKLPAPVDDLARIWAYTGMQTSEQKSKPALAVWDTYLHARYVRARQ